MFGFRASTLAFCLLLAASDLGAIERFALSSVRQIDDRPPKVRVYLDLDAPTTDELEALTPSSFAVTLGEANAEPVSVLPFEKSGEGVAYIFLVDISKSLTAQQFAAIRQAIGTWIDGFRPQDRGAILAFGNESRTVVDFTADLGVLKEGLASLGPTADRTLFHRALGDALDLSRRKDPEIPGRRVIIVLTDGLDEGSGLALEDVLENLRADPVPIHAIGYSRLRPAERRTRYLEILKRLASNSGGSFFEARRSDFAESYEEIRKRIGRVVVLDVLCEECRSDGDRYRLQVTLSAGDRVLSQGRDVRLLPDPTKPRRQEPGDPIQSGEPQSGEPQSGEPQSEQEAQGAAQDDPDADLGWRAVPWWIYLIVVALLSLLIALLLGVARRKARAPEGDEDLAEEPAAPVEKRPEPILPTEPESPPPPRPKPVRLIVVRGSRKGKEYWVTLRERAVIGSRSTCDCVLAETGIGAEQFELFQDDGQVFIRNLAASNPTRMGGHAVTEATRLKSGDLVGTSETILRILLET